MTRLGVLLICGVLLGSSPVPAQNNRQAAGNASARGGGGAKGNTWHMKRAVYRSATSYNAIPAFGIPARQGREVDAMSMLIPLDWTFQAGDAPAPLDCNMTAGRIIAQAISPEKTAGLQIIPGRVSMWSNDRNLLQAVQQNNQQFHNSTHCEIEQPQPLSAAIGKILGAKNREIQVTGPMQPVPGLSDKLDGMLAQANRSLAQQGAHVEATAGRIPTRGTTNGVATEGFFSVMQVVRTDHLPNGSTVVTTDYPIQVNMFAPEGRLAGMEPMLNAMLDSVVVDPEFEAFAAQVSANLLSMNQQTKQKLQQIAGQMAADNANAARQQATIRAGAAAYANQSRANVAANRSAALDHSSQQFALYMGDQAIYKDPSTGARVQMSGQYSHAWASGNGSEYILTDSANYNPNGQVGSSGWTQLQQEK